MNDWIEWKGGDRAPVSEDTEVNVQCREGTEVTASAGGLRWAHRGTAGDIVAYRIAPANPVSPPPLHWCRECQGHHGDDYVNCKAKKPADPVNHPPHYTAGAVECIDAIEAALTPEEFRGYCKGNALKYIWRERHKGGAESLAKAQWYLNRLEGPTR